MKKRIIAIIATISVLLIFGIFALGSSGESDTTSDQGIGSATQTQTDTTAIGNYSVDIKSCRLATDYEGKDIVIITFGYTNNKDTATSFTTAVETAAFQSGVGLNECYFVDDSANYSADNQSKELQKGASLDVEVAYELNDTATDVVVEVSKWLSFDDKKLTKTFTIA